MKKSKIPDNPNPPPIPEAMQNKQCEYCGTLDGIHANHCPGIHAKPKFINVVEIKRLSCNWRQELQKAGDVVCGGAECDVFEVGKDGVEKIMSSGPRQYTVMFDDGRMTEIYNPNKAEYFPVDEKVKP